MVWDIAKRIDRCHWIPSVVAEHMHFTQGKSQTDDTYRRPRSGDGGNTWHEDGEMYHSAEMESVREAAAQKLRGVMK